MDLKMLVNKINSNIWEEWGSYFTSKASIENTEDGVVAVTYLYSSMSTTYKINIYSFHLDKSLVGGYSVKSLTPNFEFKSFPTVLLNKVFGSIFNKYTEVSLDMELSLMVDGDYIMPVGYKIKNCSIGKVYSEVLPNSSTIKQIHSAIIDRLVSPILTEARASGLLEGISTITLSDDVAYIISPCLFVNIRGSKVLASYLFKSTGFGRSSFMGIKGSYSLNKFVYDLAYCNLPRVLSELYVGLVGFSYCVKTNSVEYIVINTGKGVKKVSCNGH